MISHNYLNVNLAINRMRVLNMKVLKNVMSPACCTSTEKRIENISRELDALHGDLQELMNQGTAEMKKEQKQPPSQ